MTTNTLDLIKWLNHSIGFDSMINDFARVEAHATNYPPYNILKKDDVTVLEFALAGYSVDDLSVTVEGNTLVVKGERSDGSNKEYFHRGISSRAFMRSFVLAEHATIESATYKDGMLTITVKIVLPEEKKPRKIPIF